MMWYIEPAKTPDQLRMHISMIHGIYVEDVKKVEGLRDCHNTDHDERFSHACIDHTHQEEK